VGVAHPLVFPWLQVPVGKVVSELEVPLATNTLASVVSSATASGPDPVETEPSADALEGLPVLPSLSTLSVLEDLLAT
jgi:hypothetical protein